METLGGGATALGASTAALGAAGGCRALGGAGTTALGASTAALVAVVFPECWVLPQLLWVAVVFPQRVLPQVAGAAV